MKRVELEQLVESLYAPGHSPDEILAIQQRLTMLQRSNDGWSVADMLLKSEFPNCQFFGALTIAVRLNILSQNEIEDPKRLLSVLLGYLINLIHSSRRVVLKLLSILSTYFIKFPGQWQYAVPSLILSLVDQRAVIIDNGEIPDSRISALNISSLPLPVISLALNFCSELAHGIGQQDTPPAVTAAFVDNTPVFSDLVMHILNNGNNLQAEDIIVDAVNCLGEWTNVFMTIQPRSQEIMAQLQERVTYLLIAMGSSSSQSPVMEAAANSIAETYSQHPAFFTSSMNKQLEGILLEQRFSPDMDEAHLLVITRLNIAYARSNLATIMNPNAPANRLLMVLANLFGLVENFNDIDPNFFTELLEFWSEYSDFIVMDLGQSTSREVVTEQVLSLLNTVVDLNWYKILLPQPPWGKESMDALWHYRRDFKDFLEMTYEILGSDFLRKLVDNIITSSNWMEVEASMYCLNGIADAIFESPQEVEILRALLSSNILERLDTCDQPQVRSTAVNLIGSLDSFYETQCPEYVPSGLNFLFKSLLNGNALLTSKSIEKLCGTARSSLTEFISTFFEIYESMGLYKNLDSVAHERTVHAISYVIEAMGDLEEKQKWIARLVGILIMAIETALQTPDVDPAAVKLKVEELMKAVSAVGRGLQIPRDNVPRDEMAEKFWNADRLHIRQQTVQLIELLAIRHPITNADPSICEVCCDVLKSGFSETVANPFVFPSEVVVGFLEAKRRQAMYSSLVDLACRFISSHNLENTDGDKEEIVANLLVLFLPTNAADRAEAQAGLLNFMVHATAKFGRFPRKVDSHAFFEFALAGLTSNDRFILRYASQFWVKLLSSDPDCVVTIESPIGESLCRILVDKVSGDAARSELELYVDVLKKLIFKLPLQAKRYLLAFLVQSPINKPLENQSEKVRSAFLERILRLRGGRETLKVVKSFWLQCRGISDYT